MICFRPWFTISDSHQVHGTNNVIWNGLRDLEKSCTTRDVWCQGTFVGSHLNANEFHPPLQMHMPIHFINFVWPSLKKLDMLRRSSVAQWYESITFNYVKQPFHFMSSTWCKTDGELSRHVFSISSLLWWMGSCFNPTVDVWINFINPG